MSETPDSGMSLVDREGALKRLGNDQQLFNDFILIFLEDTPELLSKLEFGLRNDNARQVTDSAHSLKGLISNFGAEACVDIASKIEVGGRNGDISQCSAEFERLKPLFERLKNELEAMLNG